MYDIQEILDEVTSDLIGQMSKFILDLKKVLPYGKWVVVAMQYRDRFNIDLFDE